LTEITLFTHQKFPVPPALAWLHVDRYPEVYAALVSDAYKTFVAQTLENLRRHAEGRPYRIGRPPHAAARSGGPLLTGDVAVAGATAVGALVEVLNRGPALAEAVQRFFVPAGRGGPGRPAG
jgi:hypothetical protein